MSSTPSHTCGDHLELIERVRDFPIHGTTVPISEELYRCAVCGREEYSYEQAIAAERRAGRVYREQNGFLQRDEIAALRRRWGVTQAQLEAALGLGRKTVARWEAGRVLQTRALDNLLRAIDRFPAVLAFLAERQGTRIDPDPRWAGAAPSDAAPELTLPTTLRARLEDEAREEGVGVDAYAAMVIVQGLERRATDRDVERLHRKLDDVLAHVSRPDADTPRTEPAVESSDPARGRKARRRAA